MKHGKVNLTETEESVSLSKRNTLKWLGAGSVLLSGGLPAFSAAAAPAACDNSARLREIPYLGKHQAGVITPEQKEAIFLSLNLTVKTLDEVEDVFRRLTGCIAEFLVRH